MNFTSLACISASALLLSGCGMTESRVRQQIVESEARTASAQAQLEDRTLERFRRSEQATADLVDRLRRETEARAEDDRRRLAELLRLQRDTLQAQVRVLDEAIAAYAAGRGPQLATPR